MKILVTGYKGFIGTWLGDWLTENNCCWYGIDLKEGKDIADTPIDEDTTHIVHLAAEASVIGDTLPDIETNILKNEKFLLHIPESVQQIIFASSSAVYGDTEEIPMTEITPTNPICVYGLSKLWMEHRLHMFMHGRKLSVYILRFPNIVGWGQPSKTEGNIIPKMFDYAYGRASLILRGFDKTSRDFVHVADIVETVWGIIHSSLTERFAVYCLGSGKSIRLVDLWDKVARITNTKRGTPPFLPLYPGEMVQTQLSCARAWQDLNYAVNWNVDEILKDYHQRFLSR